LEGINDNPAAEVGFTGIEPGKQADEVTFAPPTNPLQMAYGTYCPLLSGATPAALLNSVSQ